MQLCLLKVSLNFLQECLNRNLCKVSTSSSLVIGGNPYSSAETPSGNIMEVQPDEELFDDVVEGWASLVES